MNESRHKRFAKTLASPWIWGGGLLCTSLALIPVACSNSSSSTTSSGSDAGGGPNGNAPPLNYIPINKDVCSPKDNDQLEKARELVRTVLPTESGGPGKYTTYMVNTFEMCGTSPSASGCEACVENPMRDLLNDLDEAGWANQFTKPGTKGETVEYFRKALQYPLRELMVHVPAESGGELRLSQAREVDVAQGLMFTGDASAPPESDGGPSLDGGGDGGSEADAGPVPSTAELIEAGVLKIMPPKRVAYLQVQSLHPSCEKFNQAAAATSAPGTNGGSVWTTQAMASFGFYVPLTDKLPDLGAFTHYSEVEAALESVPKLAVDLRQVVVKAAVTPTGGCFSLVGYMQIPDFLKMFGATEALTTKVQELVAAKNYTAPERPGMLKVILRGSLAPSKPDDGVPKMDDYRALQNPADIQKAYKGSIDNVLSNPKVTVTQ